MNPSAAGWINKFGSLVRDQSLHYTDFESLYAHLKETGFIYGLNVGIPAFIKPEHRLSEDEKAKINLLAALYFTYGLYNKNKNFSQFLSCIFRFYKALDVTRISFLNKILTGRQTYAQLEQLLESRVYLDDNLISKTFNTIITNSLLFIDVLTFIRYLNKEEAIRQHARDLEVLVLNITYDALNSKEKNSQDRKLAQLLQASLTLVPRGREHFDASYRKKLKTRFSPCENRYFLDVACLTVWEDKVLEATESGFIYGIGHDLGQDDEHIARSLAEVTTFFEKNGRKIPYLKNRNMAGQFYDSMSRIVNKLILRNSKRLQKELSESKELMYLLTKSTSRELSEEEKKKVYNQLIDIFKSIPSLAIFILPGGAVLLPIFIKLIPKLLPSSFDENRVE